MAKQPSSDLVQGTLDMLVLRALKNQVLHGFAIARSIQQASAEHLKVEEGSLYPALHRMERRGWIESEWGLSDSNRRAKYYRITPAGRSTLTSAATTSSRLASMPAVVICTAR